MSVVAKSRRKLWPKLVIGILGVTLLILVFTEFLDWRDVREWMQHRDVRLLLVLMAFLPLFGFSISVVYLVIGAVFGGPMGVVVVAGISAVHLLGSHWLGHGYLREPLRRWMARNKHQLPVVPQGEDISVALMTALVPALPYFVRNYLLAISGIPLRTYFWVCWPIYVIRSCLVIFLGDFSDNFNSKRLIILAAVFVLKVSICAYVLYRLRVKSKRARAGTARTALQKRLSRIGRLD